MGISDAARRYVESSRANRAKIYDLLLREFRCAHNRFTCSRIAVICGRTCMSSVRRMSLRL